MAASRSIVLEALVIGDQKIRNVLVPRQDVVFIQADCSAAEGVAALVASGHASAPVVRRDLDDVIGVVHFCDLVLGGTTAGDLCHRAVALLDSDGVIYALRRLRAENEQLAVVTSAYGSTQGIVTVEDLIERLVEDLCDDPRGDGRASPWPSGCTVPRSGRRRRPVSPRPPAMRPDRSRRRRPGQGDGR